jgi:hypothetical protein
VIPLAHAGHWFAGLLYLAPVAIIVGFLGTQWWRDRRGGVEEPEDEPEEF